MRAHNVPESEEKPLFEFVRELLWGKKDILGTSDRNQNHSPSILYHKQMCILIYKCDVSVSMCACCVVRY